MVRRAGGQAAAFAVSAVALTALLDLFRAGRAWAGARVPALGAGVVLLGATGVTRLPVA